MATAQDTQLLYIAYFGRPADPSGFDYWTVPTGAPSKLPLDEVADYFAQDTEYLQTTAGLNNEQIINSFYVNLFGRNADPGGLAYWLLRTTPGKVAGESAVPGESLIDVQDVGYYIGLGALDLPNGSPDKVALQAKLAAADRWTKEVGLNVEATNRFAGPLAATYGVDFLRPVKVAADVPSVEATQAAIEHLPPVGTVAILSNNLPLNNQKVSEGDSVTFTIQSIPNLAGETLAYQLKGIDAADIVGGILSGSLLVDQKGVATLTVTIAKDAVIESNEVLEIFFPDKVVPSKSIVVSKPKGYDKVTILDASPVPTLQVQASSTSVNEGGVLSFLITSTNLAAGSQVNWTLAGTGLTPADVNNAPLSGTVTLNPSGQATITFNISNDLTTEGAETVTFSATAVGTSATGSASSVINDSSVTPDPTRTFVLTTNQDIISGTKVPLFRFIGNEQTLGQGDRLSKGEAEEAVLEVDTVGSFNLKNFSTFGLSALVINGDGVFAKDDSFVAMSNTDISNIAVIRALQEHVLFNDIQVGDLNVLLKDSLGDFEFNFDVSVLEGIFNTATVALDEIPVDQLNGGVGLYFSQAPTKQPASLERLEILSGNDSGNPATNETNVIRRISVGDALRTLTFEGSTSVEVLEDLGSEGEKGYANGFIKLIDAFGLQADLTLEYTTQIQDILPPNDNPDVDVVGAQGNNSLKFNSTGPLFADFGVITFGGDDFIVTDGGDDRILAGEGNNTVFAGSGNNKVTAGDGNNLVTSGNGNDDITLGNGNNTVNAGGGANKITLGNGVNVVQSGDGADTIITGSGNDSIDAGSGNNFVNAGAGNNTVNTGSGNDTVVTGAGNDVINVGGGNNSVNAGGGNNRIVAGSGNDDITTGDGNDTVIAGNGNNTIRSFGGDDIIAIGNGRDIVSAGTGNDTIYLEAKNLQNNDVIDGGDGTVDFISFTEGDRVGRSETAGVRNIEGFELLNLGVIPEGSPFLDPSTVDFLYSPVEPYFITLDQALVASSDDVRNGEPFGLPQQSIRFFTIDADRSASSVTIDATFVQQTDGDLVRQGLIYKGIETLFQAGFEERVIVSDTLNSGSLVLDYGAPSLLFPNLKYDDRDVLEIQNGATFTEADLINIINLDRIVLSAPSSVLGQVYDLTLTQEFLSKQGGNNAIDRQFVVTADPSLPPLSELTLRLSKVDPGNLDITERVLALVSANLKLTVIDADTGAIVDPLNYGEYDLQRRDALFFTENNDDLLGTAGNDYFYAFEGGDMNPGDRARGGAGYDILEFEFGVFNVFYNPQITATVTTGPGFCPSISIANVSVELNDLTLSEQLSLAGIQGIEEFIFDPKNDKGVRFDGLNVGQGQIEQIDLRDLDILRTTPGAGYSSGADLLFIDDVSGDAGADYGFANLAVFTYDGNDTIDASPSKYDLLPDGKYWIESGNGDDLIFAIDYTGNDATGDTIRAGAGNDTVITVADLVGDGIRIIGSGNNSIDAGDGNNLVVTGFGDDVIVSFAGNDTIKSYGGNNIIQARGGNNYIEAGDGNDLIQTFGGNDSIEAGGGNNTVDAGNGNNQICADDGNNSIVTGDGNDTILVGNGNNTINSGGGNDSVVVGTGPNTINTGDGNDTVVSGSGNVSIVTGAGNDLIVLVGDDLLSSDTTVIAGSGSDTLKFSISHDTDLAPRTGSPLLPGFLPGGVEDINPVLSGIDQLVVDIAAEQTLRLADTVATQSDSGTGIKLEANAKGADVIVMAGLIPAGGFSGADGGFKVGQSLHAVTNGFYTSSDAAVVQPGGFIEAPGAGAGGGGGGEGGGGPKPKGDGSSSSSSGGGYGGGGENPFAPTTRITATDAEKTALINGFLFSDNGLKANVGAGIVGGSGDDKFVAGSKPVILLGDNEAIEKTRGFVSYMGNGGGDTITLTADIRVPDPSQVDPFSEFVRYNTAQDGTPSGQSGQLTSGFDQVFNFDNGGITLYGTDPAGTIDDGPVVDFQSVVGPNAQGVSSGISVSRSGIDSGVNIDNITGDKIVIGGALLSGITGSNGNYLLDLFSVDTGVDFNKQEALFLTNPAGLTDTSITNLQTIAEKANSLSNGITADLNTGGLIIAQGQQFSAVYYWNNDAGIGGAGAKVEQSELRLLAKVDTANLRADDFLFQATTI